MAKKKKDISDEQFEKACDKYFEASYNGEDKATLKKLFDEMIICFKKNGGLLQLFPYDIYMNNDIVDLVKAKEILSQDLFNLVISLSNQLEGNNDYVYDDDNAPLINYEAYHLMCTDVALNFVMLTGTTAFVNSKYLQGLEKKSFDRDLEYMKNSSKLVQDEMVYSNQWRILFRHYKKEVYNLYTEERLGDIDFADYEDYQKILNDMISNSSMTDELDMKKGDYEYLTKYGLKDYYPFPKNRK